MTSFRLTRYLAVCLAGASLTACRDFAAPALPTGAVPMTAPSEYRTWWTQVQRCAQHWGNFDPRAYFVQRCGAIVAHDP